MGRRTGARLSEKRPIPRDEDAARALRKRTLTNPDNARPQWFADVHETLDAAVAAAYKGASPTMTPYASCWRSTAATVIRA